MTMQLEFQLPQRPKFLDAIHMQPFSNGVANKLVGRREDGGAIFILQESAEHPAHWKIMHVDIGGAHLTELGRPAHESGVVQLLSALDNLGDFDWRYGTDADLKMINCLEQAA
jgi:hypothetical protein